jgi:hypothetical protein
MQKPCRLLRSAWQLFSLINYHDAVRACGAPDELLTPRFVVWRAARLPRNSDCAPEHGCPTGGIALAQRRQARTNGSRGKGTLSLSQTLSHASCGGL